MPIPTEAIAHIIRYSLGTLELFGVQLRRMKFFNVTPFETFTNTIIITFQSHRHINSDRKNFLAFFEQIFHPKAIFSIYSSE